MKEKETAYTLVDVQVTQDDSEVAYEATKRVLQEHPEINYIYITTQAALPVYAERWRSWKGKNG